MDISSELVKKCCRGDSRAQFELYAMYARAMYNVSCRIIPDRMEAEDAMQEAFFKAFDRISTFRGEVTFGAWLKRIVINTCLDHLKKRRVQLVSFDDLPGLAEHTDSSDDYTPESVEQVKLAMQQLPEGYRVVLTLRLVEELDYPEIAEMLDINESSVRSQYTRGRQKLVELLKRN